MRPVALLAFFVALGGCSLPYADTSFKAVPKAAEHEVGHEAGGEEHAKAEPVVEARTEPSEMARTASAFPKDSPPSGGEPDMVKTTIDYDAHPSHAKTEGE